MRIKKLDVAISEVVGTLLLLAIAVFLFSIVYVVVFSISPSPPIPNANLVCRLDENNNIVIDHRGGESLSLDTTLMVTIGGETKSVKIRDYLDEKYKADGYWDFCEQVVYPAGDVTGLLVQANVIDESSSSVILFGVLQEGATSIIPSVVTLDASEISQTSAKLRMTYNFRNYSGYIRFTYKPIGGEWINTTWVANSGAGSYNVTIDGLSFNTIYYFKAQLTYDSTWINGSEKSFTTKEPPQVKVPLETSIDTISPYEITTSPVQLTASGDARLNNVTLHYRWSANNWTNNWQTLMYDDFENGWGNYYDGGGDCCLYTRGAFAYQGRNAVNIQDNSGDASSFYLTDGIDVDTPGYTSIKVDFWFIAWSMERNEDFFVEYYDGSTWHIVAEYDSGDEFYNYMFYHEVVWINETNYTFPKDMKIKFRCDASSNWDDVYIDKIYINVTPVSTEWTVWSDNSNPDKSSPWSWSFDFPMGFGYYEFYSIGKHDSETEESPDVADARCYLAREYLGLVAYGECGLASPRFRKWDGEKFEDEQTANPASTNINWIVVKSSPTNKNEKIMGVLSSNNHLYIQTWDGSSWTSNWNTNLGKSDVRSFDIAYEKNSGDVIVVFGDNSNQLKYRKRISEAWDTSNQNAGVPLSGVPYWVVAEQDPTSDDIMVATLDTSYTIEAIRWNGTSNSWQDQQTMSSISATPPAAEPYPHDEILKTAYAVKGRYGLAVNGVGLMDYPHIGDIELTIPGPPVQAYLYWNGFGPYGDDTITLKVDGGGEKTITGSLIGTCWWYSNKYSYNYRADITQLVLPGVHTYTISDFDIYRRNGAVITVIYEKHDYSTRWMELKDGLDCFYYGHLPPRYPETGGPDSEVITYYFPPSTVDRESVITFIVGGIQGRFRGSAIWIETGTGVQTHTNLVDEPWGTNIGEDVFSHNKGREMDVVPMKVTIPAYHNFISVQIESPDDDRGISCHWMAASLEIKYEEPTAGVKDKLCFDVAYESSSGDAFVIWGDCQRNLMYREFNGAWQQETNAYAGLPDIVYWLEAASDPKSDKISVIWMDGNGNIEFSIWTGSSWVTKPSTICGYYKNYKQISTAFESDTSEALFIFTTCYCPRKIYWRTWSESTGFSNIKKEIYKSSNKITWVQLIPDPQSDDMLAFHIDKSKDIEYRRWNGSSFHSPQEIENHASTYRYQPFMYSWKGN